MDIMSMFRPKQEVTPVAPAATDTPVTPGNIPPVVPVPAATPVKPEEPVSPLDQFSKLWETDPTKEEEGGTKPLSEAELRTAVSKADFSKSITPEMLASITAGGDEAGAAFKQAMNAVAQQSMVQSTLVSNKLMEQAVAAALAKQSSSLPKLLREQQAADHLKTSNPLFNNPAVKPVIEATRQQLLRQFPDATSTEITAMTNDYITALGESFAPKPVVKPNAEDVDWDSFLQ